MRWVTDRSAGTSPVKSPNQAACIWPGTPFIALTENTEPHNWSFTKYSDLGNDAGSENNHV